MLHHVKVDPVRVLYDDPGLLVRVRRVVGYRYHCSCGETGSSRKFHALARLDGIEHRESVSEERPPFLEEHLAPPFQLRPHEHGGDDSEAHV